MSLTVFDQIAILLLAGVVLIAVASPFVPALSRILKRKSPRFISITALAVLALLLLFLLSGPK